MPQGTRHKAQGTRHKAQGFKRNNETSTKATGMNKHHEQAGNAEETEKPEHQSSQAGISHASDKSPIDGQGSFMTGTSDPK